MKTEFYFHAQDFKHKNLNSNFLYLEFIETPITSIYSLIDQSIKNHGYYS